MPQWGRASSLAGDMLFMPPGTARRDRIHGSYISEEEIKKVVDLLKEQAAPSYEAFMQAPCLRGRGCRHGG